MRKPVRRRLMMTALLLMAPSATASAAEIRAAVAANFATPAEAIADAFRRETGTRVVISAGATGQLFAQATQGAPFAVFLAADSARPRRAEETGLAVKGSRFTYAIGRLVLFSAEPDRVRGAITLREGAFTRLAIANPDTAPYGAAALRALEAIGLGRALADRLVRGQSVTQAYQFVRTGNAELGLVALSQVTGHDQGSRWLVPDDLHDPIAQEAVLFTQAAEDPAARSFLAFLRSGTARALIRAHGYALP